MHYQTAEKTKAFRMARNFNLFVACQLSQCTH